MNLLRTLTLCTSATLVFGCIAKDSDSLGGVEDSGTDDGTTPTTSMDGGESAGDSGGDSATTAEDGGSGAPACADPAQVPHSPAACPDGVTPVLAEAGCFEPCDGIGSPCSTGTCTSVQVNPCDCEDGINCCAACAGNSWLCLEPEQIETNVCALIIGTTFFSVEELECGLSPEGPVLCNWRLSFESDNTYTWNYSDVGEGGNYTCIDGVITPDAHPDIEVSYDAKADRLTWDGVVYAPSDK